MNSEEIEVGRAQLTLNKAKRRASWERRGEVIAAIQAQGFTVKAMGSDQMHFRIRLGDGKGFVDFWPSTMRWHHKLKGQNTPHHTGEGLKSMLHYLRGDDT